MDDRYKALEKSGLTGLVDIKTAVFSGSAVSRYVTKVKVARLNTEIPYGITSIFLTPYGVKNSQIKAVGTYTDKFHRRGTFIEYEEAGKRKLFHVRVEVEDEKKKKKYIRYFDFNEPEWIKKVGIMLGLFQVGEPETVEYIGRFLELIDSDPDNEDVPVALGVLCTSADRAANQVNEPQLHYDHNENVEIDEFKAGELSEKLYNGKPLVQQIDASTVTLLEKPTARKAALTLLAARARFGLRRNDFSVEDMKFVPVIDENKYVPPLELQDLLELSEAGVLYNVMLYGEPGTGKSELVRAFAYCKNLPLKVFSADSSTEKLDTVMGFVPNERVYEKKDLEDNAPFRVNVSAIIDALVRGYCVEVQEASQADPSVWISLNSILNVNEGVITLQTGEVVKRHPDSAVFFTTNPDTEGDRGYHEATENRFSIKKNLKKPDADEMLKRLTAYLDLNNDETKDMRLMIKACDALDKFQEQHPDIKRVELGFRVLCSWMEVARVFEDPWKAAEYSLVGRFGSEYQKEAETVLSSFYERTN